MPAPKCIQLVFNSLKDSGCPNITLESSIKVTITGNCPSEGSTDGRYLKGVGRRSRDPPKTTPSLRLGDLEHDEEVGVSEVGGVPERGVQDRELEREELCDEWVWSNTVNISTGPADPET